MRRPIAAGALGVTSLVLVASLAACGGSASTSTTTEPTNLGSAAPTDEGAPPSSDPPDETPQATGAAAPAAGDDSASYKISGDFEADGQQPFNPGMSFFDSGHWTASFGDGTKLLLISLDPSTPSINFTDGTHSLGGTGSECTFETVSQDASGAAGSFDCHGVPATDAAGLGTADISGSFSFTV